MGIIRDVGRILEHSDDVARAAEHEFKPATRLIRDAEDARDVARLAAPRMPYDQAPLFHGTPTPWISHEVRPITAGAKHDNLFGPGLYMTENRRIAESYVGKDAVPGRIGMGEVYGMQWREKPNLIDLDKPVPDEVRDIFAKHLDPISDRAGYPRVRGRSGLAQMLDVDMTGADVYEVAKGHSTEEELLGLAKTLREHGYHGFTHTGGTRWGTGETLHQVSIAFDPVRDIEVVGHKAVSTHTPKFSDLKRQVEDLTHQRSAEAAKLEQLQARIQTEPQKWSEERIKEHASSYRGRMKRLDDEIEQRQAYMRAIQQRVEQNVAISQRTRALASPQFQRAPSSGRMGGVPTRSTALRQLRG